MPSQSEKYAVSLAGEHYVAAELLRRGITASITLGNAKNVDILVLNRATMKAMIVEVKSSSRLEWIVGSGIPAASAQPWVFVHVPEDGTSPRYFIVTARIIQDLLAPGDASYRKAYQTKHHKPFAGKGVCKLRMDQILHYENIWTTITDLVA